MGTASHSPPHLSESLIQAFLARLGERYEKPATFYLLGGSALLLLGSPHRSQAQGGRTGRGPRIVPISEFIESELARLENKPFEQEYDKPIAPVGEFNDLFRLALDEVWSSY